jgi:hypothetical protein
MAYPPTTAGLAAHPHAPGNSKFDTIRPPTSPFKVHQKSLYVGSGFKCLVQGKLGENIGETKFQSKMLKIKDIMIEVAQLWEYRETRLGPKM